MLPNLIKLAAKHFLIFLICLDKLRGQDEKLFRKKWWRDENEKSDPVSFNMKLD